MGLGLVYMSNMLSTVVQRDFWQSSDPSTSHCMQLPARACFTYCSKCGSCSGTLCMLWACRSGFAPRRCAACAMFGYGSSRPCATPHYQLCITSKFTNSLAAHDGLRAFRGPACLWESFVMRLHAVSCTMQLHVAWGWWSCMRHLVYHAQASQGNLQPVDSIVVL